MVLLKPMNTNRYQQTAINTDENMQLGLFFYDRDAPLSASFYRKDSYGRRGRGRSNVRCDCCSRCLLQLHLNALTPPSPSSLSSHHQPVPRRWESSICRCGKRSHSLAVTHLQASRHKISKWRAFEDALASVRANTT